MTNKSTWTMGEAKAKLCQVLEQARSGPQTITRRNDTVVMVSAAKDAELTGTRPTFKDFLMQGESFEGLDLARDQSPSRDLDL